MKPNLRAVIIICFILAAALYFSKFLPLKSTDLWAIIRQILINTLVGGILIVIALDFGFKLFNRISLKGFLLILPCLLISLNNFPIIAAISGRAHITADKALIWLFALECLSVALFEEVCFRGIIFLFILNRIKKDRFTNFKAIVYSSAIFALAHILNIFEGAGAGETILQVGYTFLTGSMWAAAVLLTGGISAGIVLHAAYNFGGMLFLRLGTITLQWDIATIVLTAALSVIVGVYLLYLILKMPLSQGKLLYKI